MEMVDSQPQPSEPPSMDVRTLACFYSNHLWNQLTRFFPGSTLHRKIFNFYRQIYPRRRRPFLPLPLPSNTVNSSVIMTEASRFYDILGDIMEQLFTNLHHIQKNLQFWQSRAEGSNSRKAYFMILERGPLAFVDETANFLRECMDEGSAMQHLCQSASAHMSERIAVLTALRKSIATFLAQMYVEIDKYGEQLVKDPEKTLLSLLITINDLFMNLEASIGHLHAMRQSDSTVDGSYSVPLMFERLPEIIQEGSQWTDSDLKDAISLVDENLHKLDSYVSLMVTKHQKPRKLTLYWMRYTLGAVGLSACSVWLLQHSSLMGSSDIDNWISEAKEATVSFFSFHVEQPILSIRDELFETFRKRHEGVMSNEEVQLTSKSLHRMLLAFSEQTKGIKFPQNAADQEMLEIVMSRYEKEMEHPIQNLLGGELPRALLIQVQKLKLDIETAMLELDQILRANEINFAILAALPAFFLFLFLVTLVRAWVKQDTKAVGRGRVARRQRRLLVIEVEKRIMQYQTYVDEGMEKEAQCMFGLMIYSLDRLYHAVEGHAKATGEWQCLRKDILDLGKPGLATANKLRLTSRMERVYDCLLPSLTR